MPEKFGYKNEEMNELLSFLDPTTIPKFLSNANKFESSAIREKIAPTAVGRGAIIRQSQI